jgi:hypothetical protein
VFAPLTLTDAPDRQRLGLLLTKVPADHRLRSPVPNPRALLLASHYQVDLSSGTAAACARSRKSPEAAFERADSRHRLPKAADAEVSVIVRRSPSKARPGNPERKPRSSLLELRALLDPPLQSRLARHGTVHVRLRLGIHHPSSSLTQTRPTTTPDLVLSMPGRRQYAQAEYPQLRP